MSQKQRSRAGRNLKITINYPTANQESSPFALGRKSLRISTIGRVRVTWETRNKCPSSREKLLSGFYWY